MNNWPGERSRRHRKPNAETHDPAANLNGASGGSADDDATNVGQDEASPDEPDQDEPEAIGALDEPEQRPRPAPKPARPSIIERFAEGSRVSGRTAKSAFCTKTVA